MHSYIGWLLGGGVDCGRSQPALPLTTVTRDREELGVEEAHRCLKTGPSSARSTCSGPGTRSPHSMWASARSYPGTTTLDVTKDSQTVVGASMSRGLRDGGDRVVSVILLIAKPTPTLISADATITRVEEGSHQCAYTCFYTGQQNGRASDHTNRAPQDIMS